MRNHHMPINPSQLDPSENIHESFGAVRIDLAEELAAFMQAGSDNGAVKNIHKLLDTIMAGALGHDDWKVGDNFFNRSDQI